MIPKSRHPDFLPMHQYRLKRRRRIHQLKHYLFAIYPEMDESHMFDLARRVYMASCVMTRTHLFLQSDVDAFILFGKWEGCPTNVIRLYEKSLRDTGISRSITKRITYSGIETNQASIKLSMNHTQPTNVRK